MGARLVRCERKPNTDLGGEVRQGGEVVAEGGGLGREPVAGELHAVAGVTGEADHNPINLADVRRARPPTHVNAHGLDSAFLLGHSTPWPTGGAGPALSHERSRRATGVLAVFGDHCSPSARRGAPTWC